MRIVQGAFSMASCFSSSCHNIRNIILHTSHICCKLQDVPAGHFALSCKAGQHSKGDHSPDPSILMRISPLMCALLQYSVNPGYCCCNDSQFNSKDWLLLSGWSFPTIYSEPEHSLLLKKNQQPSHNQRPHRPRQTGPLSVTHLLALLFLITEYAWRPKGG